MNENNESKRKNIPSLDDTLTRYTPAPLDGLMGDRPSPHRQPPQEDTSTDGTLVKGFSAQTHYPASDRTYPRMSAISRHDGDDPRHSYEEATEPDSNDYAFSRYRRNRPALSNQHAGDPDTTAPMQEQPRRPRQSRYSSEEDSFAPRPSNKVYKKIEPERRDFNTQPIEPPSPRRKPPAMSRRRYEEDDIPKKRPRFSPYNDRDVDSRDDDFERQPLSVRLIVAASGAFLGVVILSVMVFQIISTNQRLTEVTAEADRAGNLQLALSAAQIEIQDLEDELNQARARIQTLESFGVPTLPPTPEVSAPTPPSYRWHTVAPGETLSQIAAHHYQDSSQAAWQRIIDANDNVTPQSIRVGQQLRIPDID